MGKKAFKHSILFFRLVAIISLGCMCLCSYDLIKFLYRLTYHDGYGIGVYILGGMIEIQDYVIYGDALKYLVFFLTFLLLSSAILVISIYALRRQK